jgi:hypothetical protein
MMNIRELPTEDQMPEWMALELAEVFNKKRERPSLEEDYSVTDPLFSMRMSRVGGGINVPGDGIDDLRILSAQECADEDFDGIPDHEDDDTHRALKKLRKSFMMTD